MILKQKKRSSRRSKERSGTLKQLKVDSNTSTPQKGANVADLLFLAFEAGMKQDLTVLDSLISKERDEYLSANGETLAMNQHFFRLTFGLERHHPEVRIPTHLVKLLHQEANRRIEEQSENELLKTVPQQEVDYWVQAPSKESAWVPMISDEEKSSKDCGLPTIGWRFVSDLLTTGAQITITLSDPGLVQNQSISVDAETVVSLTIKQPDQDSLGAVRIHNTYVFRRILMQLFTVLGCA